MVYLKYYLIASEPIIYDAKQFNRIYLLARKVITSYADDSAIIASCQTKMDQILESFS